MGEALAGTLTMKPVVGNGGWDVRKQAARWMVPGLVAIMVLTSCGGTSPTKQRGTSAPPVTGAQIAERLEGAGVPVVPDPTGRAQRYEFLARQADAMALEATAHGGFTGAQLDGLAPGVGALPASYLLAAYVKNGDTAGAKWAQSRIGKVNWNRPQAIVFPSAVIALFVGEVLPPIPPSGGPGKTRGALSQVRPMDGNACTALSNWVQEVLNSLFNALKIASNGEGFTGLLADIWNTAVDLAQGALEGLVKQVTKPVIDAVTGVLAVLGTIAMAASLLKPWTVAVTAKPGTVKFGVNAPGESGAFTAKAVGPQDPWPADIRECAQAAGVTLPDPSDVSGSNVSWAVTGLPPFGEQLERTDVLGKDGTATLAFRAGTEASSKGPLLTDVAAATVTVARTDIEQFRNFLTNLLFGGFPGIIGQAIAAIVNALTQPVIDELAAMVSPSGSGWVAITHHGPEDECEAPPAGIVPDGTWSGPIALDVSGQPASLSGVILSNGAGQAQMIVAGGKVTGGAWSLQSSASGTVGDGEGSGTLNAAGFTISDGVIGGPATGPVLTGTGALQGSILVTAAGMSFDVPINEVHPAGATMTIVDVTCDAVTATFIPSFNEQAGGVASFSGIATWTGRRS